MYVVGMSVVQGGPVCAIRNWTGDGQHYTQLQEGLIRSGLHQVSNNLGVIALHTGRPI